MIRIARLAAVVLTVGALALVPQAPATHAAPPAHDVYADTTAEGIDAPELPNSVYDAFATCAPVDVNELSDAAVAYLVRSDWTGDSNDNREALYAPGCVR